MEKLPMELLILLVQRKGELVSREEIAKRLWSKDVFLDVDHGINTAIRKVRAALRDDPEKPRFVETVVGKGYRFAAPVTCNGNLSLQPQPLSPVEAASAAPPPSRHAESASLPLKLAGGALVLLALFAVGWGLKFGGAHQRPAQPGIRSLAVLP
ncbi:MAG TPA: helix-turn-helix domain-containing protein, partial [Terriglobales bacterium]|nr:helix-turn-helix domain-containing protein [Terriglobales bacterium]